jgi:foldase protein PrsA
MADQYFAKHKADFQTACVSHILVTTESRSDAAAKQEIEQIKAQLDGGADFATLAKAKSEDTGSKDAGGDLGCKPGGQYVAEFEKAVSNQPVGKVGDPVKTEFGYHLILVKSRPAATLADVRQEVGQAAFNAFLLDLTCGKASKVSVDPRYGSWDKGPCTGGQGLAKVSPPKSPAKSK